MDVKALKRLILVILACMLLAGAGLLYWSSVARPGADAELLKASEGLNWYGIAVVFDPEQAKLSCTQTVEYKNNHNVEFDRLYFHLYPNAFRDEDRVPFFAEEKQRAYPNGFSPGWLDIELVTVNGNSVEFNIGGYSSDILSIVLSTPLKPGQIARIDMIYTVKLPNCIGRFGYGQHTFNVTNWYPIVGVYDYTGWNTDPYYPIGDPFYSDVANYRVEIKAPSDYTIAATGEAINVKVEGDYKVWEFQALAVRDFAWIASKDFEVLSRSVDGITVYSYFLPESRDGGEKVLDCAAAAVEIFNRRFGRYPYSQLSVVQSDFFVGGMEYPCLVMIDQSLYGREQQWLEYVTVHETAHQWWYAVVGNDQIDEAWLDEALTEYSTILYYENRYGEDVGKEVYDNVIVNGKCSYLQKYHVQGLVHTIDQPVYRFTDWLTYDLVVYGKGASLFNDLRQAVGHQTFYRILQEYYEDNKFKNATAVQLIKACEEVTGKSWEDFFEKRLKSLNW
ncbi:MAG: M1 family metallopeptidase [Caldicoprobacter oshimai]|uniref:Peptidase family M1 n=1 Tax=Caldicoprobacter faecalis TaxID=937334 RepID=A0A1I5VPV6_9FIRM|nr:M1 family metallopeptidase [Caldicoprobacter faecalis]PZN10414.1 MAG: M1 family peptidase [Caldicoprobacter oshimai]SFQ09539.1 Peptidase family M1 [Caldicoprobacter faecalis]